MTGQAQPAATADFNVNDAGLATAGAAPLYPEQPRNAWSGIGSFAKGLALTTLGLQNSKSGSLGEDYGRMLGSGIRVGIPQTVLGLGEMASGMFGAPLPVGATDAAHRWLEQTQEDIAKSLTAGAQASNEKTYFGKEATWDNLSKDGISGVPGKIAEMVKTGEFFGPAWGDFDKAGLSAVQSLPSSMLGRFPVMKAARTAYVATLERLTGTIGEKAAQAAALTAAKNTASFAAFGSEGAIGGGQQYAQTYEQVLKMPDADLEKSPSYLHAYAAQPESMPETERRARAKAITARAAALPAAAIAFVSDAVTAALGERYIGGAVSGKQGIAKSAMMGGLSELPTETVQSGLEQFGTNVGVRQFADPSQSLTADVGEQAVGGGLSGGLMGAGVGGGGAVIGKVANRLGGRTTEAAPDTPGAPPVPASDVLGRVLPDQGGPTPPPPSSPPTPELQPRNRSRPASLLQMESIANGPDFDRLGAAPTPTDGAPMIAIKGDAAEPALKGKEAVVTFANGMKVPVTYAVFDASSVLASHDIAGKENAVYASPDTVALGTPVALNSGRTIGIAEAYARGRAGEYKAKLVADAPSLGLDPAAVGAMPKPMLGRLYSDEFNKVPNIGQLSNGGGGMQMGATEQARADAANIKDLSGLVLSDNGAINVNASRAFLTQFVQNAGANDQNALVGEDKKPTAELLRRVQQAVFAKAYGGGPVLNRIAESTDDNIRRISSGMMIAAPEVASLRQDMAAGRVDQSLDLIPHFVQAMEQFSTMRANGDNVTEWLAQGDLVPKPFSPETLDILAKIHEISTSAKAVSLWLKTYAAAARAAGNTAQESLIPTAAPTKAELLQNTKERSNEAVQAAVQNAQGENAAAADTGAAPRPKSKVAKRRAGVGKQDLANAGNNQPATGAQSAPVAGERPAGVAERAAFDDTGRNLPERPGDLKAQQSELVAGRRDAVMFPNGTPELPLPAGMARAETPRGVFHFNPQKLTAAAIAEKSAAGRENELLGLGPYSKADVMARAAPGEAPFYIVERGPNGEELRGALAVKATAEATRQAFEASKAPGSKIGQESLPDMLGRRKVIAKEPKAAPAKTETKAAPVALSKITVQVQAIEADTGKKMEITGKADRVLADLDQQIETAKALLKCLS
jgi:hypothetical protein